MLGKLGVRELGSREVGVGRGGSRALHAVRVVAVGGAVGQAAARRGRVRVASGAAQVAAALAAVRVAARAAAGAALHRAAVRAALRQAVARAPLTRALVRVRVLLLGAAREHGVAVHHHVVTRRLQQPCPIATADHTSPPTLAPTRPDRLAYYSESDTRQRHYARQYDA